MTKSTTWHVFEKAMLASFRLLMPICVLACALGCWFWSAEHVYECGDPMLKLTLAYLDENALQNSTLGWKAAAAAFFFSLTNVFTIRAWVGLADWMGY